MSCNVVAMWLLCGCYDVGSLVRRLLARRLVFAGVVGKGIQIVAMWWVAGCV